uniref:Minor glycoprotein n=1 Tax=Kibale red colobus virus 2 TaxID=1936072 RepID=X2D6R0_9NIDO|nr:minor glycoprotein [Kibale red colobus virus 2]
MENHHVCRAALCSWLLCFLFCFVSGNHSTICFPVPHEYIVVHINNTLTTCSAFGWNQYPQTVGVCGHKGRGTFNIGQLIGTHSGNSSSSDIVEFQLDTNFDLTLLVYGLMHLQHFPSLFNFSQVIYEPHNTSICFTNNATTDDEEGSEEVEDDVESIGTNQTVSWPTLREFTYAFSSPLFAPAILLALPLLLVQL